MGGKVYAKVLISHDKFRIICLLHRCLSFLCTLLFRKVYRNLAKQLLYVLLALAAEKSNVR